MTHGLIYFYFPSKEDLFCAAVEYQADLVFAQLDLASERASADPPEQTLRRIVSRFVAVMEKPQNVSLMRILMREAALREPQAGCARPSRDYIRVIARDLSHELSGYLAGQVERGTLRSLDTTLAAQLMTSALISVLMRRTSSNQSGTKQSREESDRRDCGPLPARACAAKLGLRNDRSVALILTDSTRRLSGEALCSSIAF